MTLTATRSRVSSGVAAASTPARFPRLPYLISRLYFLLAVIIVLQALTSGAAWTSVTTDVFSTFFLPVDSASIGQAAFAVILGGALARRKHVGWVVTMIVFGFFLLLDLGVLYILVRAAFTNATLTVGELFGYARFALNLASLGALFCILFKYRGEFYAGRPPGRIRDALLVLFGGLALTFTIGLVLVFLFPGELSGPRGRVAWVFRRIVGLASRDADLFPTTASPPTWISSVVGIFFGVTLFAALLALVRSQQIAARMDPSDEVRLRALVAESPEDSLAYFGTRRDKSVVFAANGRAAVTFRVELGVCLASSNPLGRPDYWPGAISAWLDLTNRYGWTPAVIGASEAGAKAYAGAGLRVIQLGDEAVLETAHFSLESRDMRAVRQAVSRLERLGYRVRIHRHADLGPERLAELSRLVDAWRDTETERGFSMALGRLGDPADGNCLMVEALFPADRAGTNAATAELGEVAGILSFVPWGSDGYSLDVMRRHPQADNGVTELMVSRLMTEGRELGIRQVSLNFAVFRSAFEEGARIGAGPVLRLWRRLLLVASRWWQIESLYRSNVKYGPEWRPRFLCFAETRDIALVGAATGVAEGFIDLPWFLRPGRVRQRLATPSLPPGAAGTVEITAALAALPEPPQARVPEQVRLRAELRDRLLADGVDPYPPSFRPTARCAGLQLGSDVRVAGRVHALRDFGGVIFVRVRDWSGDAQLILVRSSTGSELMDRLRRTVDLGDHVGAEGPVVRSRSGEVSVEVRSWTLTAKSLRPLPDKWRGITDPETKVRQRYLDLATSRSAREQLARRSAILRAVRDELDRRGYLEVETPILQTVHGGANARPFRTHIQAYDLPLYLRIAPELYLKRLMVGGVDRVFEIGRNFRNEGADATHNPEFTMLEAYQAYGDYTTMREVAQALVCRAADAAGCGSLVRGTDHTGQLREVDLSEPWAVVPVNEALSRATGAPTTADTPVEDLVRMAHGHGIACDPSWTRGAVVLELYEHLVEHQTVAPTFYTDFPADVSPLTRQHRVDPRLAERWDLVAFGAEVGTAYSELVDPVVQRARLTDQSLQAAGGDPEAMELDEDFLTALEHAMPPSGGLGMGMDRLVMILTNTSIRDTIAFPLVRPVRRQGRP